MIDAQIFQLIGIAYAAAGLGIIINPDFYNKLVDSFSDNPALTYVASLLVLLAGFIIVTFHNVWVIGWPVIITIFGYAALIKGIGLLVFPRAFIAISKAMVTKLKNVRLYGAVILIIGLGFLCLGFAG
ncbi:MAG: hypothetical protein V1933_06230 [Candidatus Omnitrophota bacterium]